MDILLMNVCVGGTMFGKVCVCDGGGLFVTMHVDKFIIETEQVTNNSNNSSNNNNNKRYIINSNTKVLTS